MTDGERIRPEIPDGMSTGSEVREMLDNASRLPEHHAGPASAVMPADPFTPADMASAALADAYHGMVRAGIPKDSVERIIGCWLGALPGGGGNPR